MTVLAKFELTARDKTGQQLMGFLEAVFPRTSGFDGNQDLTLYVDPENPSRVLVLERWDSRDAFDKSLDWRAENGELPQLLLLIVGDADLEIFDPAPRRCEIKTNSNLNPTAVAANAF